MRKLYKILMIVMVFFLSVPAFAMQVKISTTGASLTYPVTLWLEDTSALEIKTYSLANASGTSINEGNYRFKLYSSNVVAAYSGGKHTYKTASIVNVPFTTITVAFDIPSHTLTGYVKNASGGAISGATVHIFEADSADDPAHYWLASTTTDGSGKYEFKGVYSDVNYHIKAEKSGYFPMFASKTTDGGEYSPVNIKGGETVKYITLRAAQTIQGTITNGDASTEVSAFLADSSLLNNDQYVWVSKFEGSNPSPYTLDVPAGVPVIIQAKRGNYITAFYKAGSSQWYDGKTASSVQGGAAGVNITLEQAGSITGTLTGAGTGLAEVIVFEKSGNELKYINSVTSNAGTSWTYNLPAPVNTSRQLVLKAGKDGHLDRYHLTSALGTYELGKATAFSLTSTTAKSGVNITLGKSITMSGNITRSGGSGLVTVNIYERSGTSPDYIYTYVNQVTVNAGTTAASYTTPILASVPQVVQAMSAGHMDRYYYGADGSYDREKAAVINQASDISPVNIKLEQAGSIKGTISGATGQVTINVYSRSGQTLEYINNVIGNAGSEYTLPAPVSSRTLVVQAEKSGYLSRFHNNTYELDKAVPITLTSAAPEKTGANIALEAAAVISGTITNGVNAKVNVFRKGSDYEYVNSVTASATGAYSMQIISGIDQVILASRTGYIDRYYQSGADGAYNREKATPQKTASSGINIILQPALAVAGSVKERGGASLSIPLTVNAFIKGRDYEAGYVTAAAVNASTGAFSMQIPDDSAGIVLQVTHNGNQLIGYKDGSWFADNGSVMSSADARVLKSGQTGLNSLQIYLDKFWLVKGAVSPDGIQGVVDLYEWDSSGINYNKNKGWVTANASGAYEIRGTGNVNVLLRAGTENYVTMYLNNTASPVWVNNSLDLVTSSAQLALAPLTTYTYNPSLTLGGQIAGTISLSSGGSGAVTVSVEDTAGKFFKEVTANVDVKYTIKGVPAGSWKVRAARGGALQTYYGGAHGRDDAAAVNLTTAGLDNIDITLPAKAVVNGTISGVSDAENVTINAFERTNGHLGRWVNSYTRSGNGDYALDIPVGINLMLMAESGGYIKRFYKNGSAGTYSDEQATQVNGAASGANITLEQAGSIKGTITSKTTSGVVTVSAFEKNGDVLTYISSITSNVGESGTYTLPTPVNTGRTLIVQAEKNGHIKRFYANAYSLGQANAFVLNSTAQKSDVNIDLEQGVALSGAITNATGVTVQVFVREAGDTQDTFLMDMRTDAANGNYTFNVPVNKNYFVRAEKTGLFAGFYRSDNAPAAFGGQDRQPIIVAASPVTGKNFSLYTARTIGGDVKYRGGADIGNMVTVNAFVASTNYTFVSAATANAANGSFNLSVPQGVALVLQVTANSTLGYASGTWFPDRESSANSTIFNLANDLAGQRFIIDKFWYLTGQIALSGNPNPIGVSVDVFEYTGGTSGTNWRWLAGVTIDNAAGDFTITSINSVEAVVRYARDGYVTMIYPDLVTLNKISAGHKQTLTIGSAPVNLGSKTLARGGSITGNITAAGSGTVTVSVEDINGEYFTEITLNAAGGTYEVKNLPAGQWLVRAAQDGAVAEYYGETASTANAAAVSVMAGNITGNVDIYIAPEWTISGNISEINSNPTKNIPNALVQAYFVTEPNTWFWVASANTDANGNYTLRGGYSNKQNDPAQVFLQIGAANYTEITTNPIEVAVGQDYAKDYVLEGAAYVQGTVVNVSANKTVTISAFAKDSNFVWLGEVTINGNDAAPVAYVLPIKVNTDLVVRAAVSGYEDLWYDNKVSSADATPVRQAVGTTKDTVNFNFAGHKQWLISGVVTDTDGNPLDGMTVNVFVKNSDYAGPDGGSVLTGADGKFSLQIAPTGDLVLQAATANPYLGYPTGTYYKKDAFGVISSADAASLAYSAGDLENIAFKINRFWLVSGSITPKNIEAVIDMYEYDGENINWDKNKGWVTANANGAYEIRGTGNVTVNIRAATGNYIAAGINQATLAPENTYTHYFNLTLGAEISGRVTANGSGTVTISVQDINGDWETYVTRDGTGDYTIPRVPAGLWLVYAQQKNCMAEYFGETVSTANARRINLTAGQVTENIDIEIDREWTIAGYVKKSDNSPVQDAEVDVWRSFWDGYIGRAKTDALGYYIVTGGCNNIDVYVRVSADGYETKYYDDKYIITEANTINMVPGVPTTDVNFILNEVWKVAGNVKDTHGNPLSDAKVSLIDQTDTQNILGVYTTDPSGEYQFISVNAVAYQLFLLVEKDNYAPSSSAAFNVVVGDSVEIYFELPLIAAPVQPLPAGQSVLDTIRSGPNPADPEKGPIHIGFILDSAARARVKIYTLGGELVFQDDQRFPPGYNEFVWSGANLYDRRLPNGVYLAYVEIDTGREKLRKVLKIAILR
ncbi:hypothetical protein NO1_0364 [Candidatus Termititenax aidoneus]|uniref:Uncharacterized protein n=1 Tax=Termititenax aidoneus TaxID=2218524 RepID=A0A388T9K1_TERA1|nr:hypothetical protein NO1_0364 [Candidatus Termititenax aidoneus]